MNDRTCIVTRRTGTADDLIRFVVGPDGSVVPDIRRKLPGRGCWVAAERVHVERAAAKGAFARAFKREVTVPENLGALVDALLSASARGALGLARKAGSVALGAAKIEAEQDEKRRALGVEDELREIPGITTAMMVKLGEDGVKTIEDFAGYAADDLTGWKERKDGETKFYPGVLSDVGVSKADAEQMILAARLRAGWITEEEAAEEPADADAGA